MRRAAKVDSNQGVIVDALRKVGAFVQPLHQIGQGCPDLAVWYRHVWKLLEIKDGSLPPSKRVLTHDEALWHAMAGPGAAIVVASVLEALTAIGAN